MAVVKRIDGRRLLMALGVSVGLVLIVLGFASVQHGDKAITLPPEVVRVVPQPGDLVLRQSSVGVQLKPGYTGVLIIDGKEIPQDQLQIDESQATIFYTARQGADIESFAPGQHSITAVFWKLTESRNESSQFTWPFKVS
jgi:hypothetical protein